jgi:signal transduction histidine kinase
MRRGVMSGQIRFPIRFKILITLMFLISMVVGVITFTMAHSFHDDKTSYIHDLTSVIALHTAEETRALFEGYRARMRMYLLILEDENMTEKQKAEKIDALFSEFSDFVAVTIYDSREHPESTVYDENSLIEAGLTKEDLLGHRDSVPLPMEIVKKGKVHVERGIVAEKLPCVQFTIAEKDDKGTNWLVAQAILRLDGLERLAARSKIFETYIADSKGGLLAHVNPAGEADSKRLSHLPTIIGEIRAFNAGMTREYPVNGETVVGGFAPSKFAGVIAGVQVPKRAAYLASRELLRTLVVTSLCLLLSSALVGLVWSRLITRPIERLSEAALALGKGQFDVKVDLKSGDEIGVLGRSFNRMGSELKARDASLADAQKAIIQSEKMAAFGQLGAGIAHEVKNPLAGILGCAQLSLLSAKSGSEEEKNLKLIEKETRRCKDIIENLLKFSRQERTERSLVDITKVVDDSVAIVRHQLEVHQISLEVKTEENLPEVMGNANQLQQVLVNLVINAQQAMQGDPGYISLFARRRGERQVVLQVQDDGPGIPPENQEKIFEPFFTTKRGKKGTGLGLSVSYGIVKDHEGDIIMESEVGKGTLFVITLPVAVGKRSSDHRRAA